VKAKRVKGLDPDAPFRANAERMLDVRLRELHKLGRRAIDPREVKAAHAARIAAKRVRYLLEITGPCFDDPGPALKRMRRLQDLLGEIHDCDEMSAQARERAAATPVSDERYLGFEALASYQEARRRVLHRHFVETWSEIEDLVIR
jgi:CHAD domain-containing protein